jgi:putative flippase GtrA
VKSAVAKSRARLQRPWHPAIADYTRMLAVGTAGFVIDFGLFNGLLALGAPPNVANLAAILVSSAVVFAVNLRWTYQHREVPLPHHSAAKFAGIQVASLTLIALGVALVTAVTSSVLVWNVAKFLLTIGIGFGRFYLYREWVYTEHGRAPAHPDCA